MVVAMATAAHVTVDAAAAVAQSPPEAELMTGVVVAAEGATAQRSKQLLHRLLLSASEIRRGRRCQFVRFLSESKSHPRINSKWRVEDMLN